MRQTVALAILVLLSGCVSYHERRIDAELAELKQPRPVPASSWAREWAGEYRGQCSPSYASFKIAPRNGVVWHSHGCFSEFSDYATIVGSTAEGVEVRWANTFGRGRWPDSESLYFVRWGERRLLVPEDDMTRAIEFWNEQREGTADVTGNGLWLMSFVHEGDEGKAIDGPVLLPKKWAPLLHRDPVRALNPEL